MTWQIYLCYVVLLTEFQYRKITVIITLSMFTIFASIKVPTTPPVANASLRTDEIFHRKKFKNFPNIVYSPGMVH
jgi:hypothetical protein